MAESEQKIEALKKVYAEMILNAAREAAARVLSAESRARRLEQDLVCTRDEASRLLQRSRQLIDAQDKEAENKLLNQKMKFSELESQLNEAEMVILDLRVELEEAQEQLGREKKKMRYSLLQIENEKVTPEADVGAYELLTTSLDPGLELITVGGNLSCSEGDKLSLSCLYPDKLIECMNSESDVRCSNDHSVLTYVKEPELITSSVDSGMGRITVNDNNSSFSEGDMLNLESCCPAKFTENTNSNCDVHSRDDHHVSAHVRERELFVSPLGCGLELVTGHNDRSDLEVDTLGIKSCTLNESTENPFSECDLHSSNDHNVFCHGKEPELLTPSLGPRREPITVKKPGLLTSLNSGLKLIAETYSSSCSDADERNICCPACAAEAALVNEVSPKAEMSGSHSNSINKNFMSVDSALVSEEEVQNEKHETVSVVRRSSRKRTIKPWVDVLRNTRKRTSKPWVDVHRNTRKRTIKTGDDIQRSTRKRIIKPWGDVNAKFGVRNSRRFKKHGMAHQQLSNCKSNRVSYCFKSAQDMFPTEYGTEIEDNLGQEFQSRKFKLIEDLQKDMKLINVSVQQESDAQMIIGSVDVVAEQDTEDLQKDMELIDVLVEKDELAAAFDLNSLSTIFCDVVGDAVSQASDVSNAETQGKCYITYSRRKKKINPLPEQTSSSGMLFVK